MRQIDLYIGEKIASLRKKRNVTQEDLAKKIKLSRQLIQKYEVGEVKIPASVLCDVANVLLVKPDHFFENIDEIKDRTLPQNDIISQERHRALNILLVEDNLADEKLTRAAIEESGCDANIYTATSGVDTLALLYNSKQISTTPRPDIIFLDLNIPKKDGMEVLKTIKMDRDIQDIPVIVITNSLSGEEMRKVYKLGACGFVVKSFHPEEFFSRIKIVLDYWNAMILPTM